MTILKVGFACDGDSPDCEQVLRDPRAAGFVWVETRAAAANLWDRGWCETPSEHLHHPARHYCNPCRRAGAAGSHDQQQAAKWLAEGGYEAAAARRREGESAHARLREKAQAKARGTSRYRRR